MLNIDREKMMKVAATASAKLNAKIKDNKLCRRWNNTIIRALVEMELGAANFMHYDEAKDTLIIWSQKSDEIYEVNDVCQCRAYLRGQPCWHRSCARLVKLYREQMN